MQEAQEKIRKSVPLDASEAKALKLWADKFHTKEEAAAAFVEGTTFYSRALARLLKSKSGRENIVAHARTVIAAGKKAK